MEVLYLYCVDIKKGINLMANAKKKKLFLFSSYGRKNILGNMLINKCMLE